MNQPHFHDAFTLSTFSSRHWLKLMRSCKSPGPTDWRTEVQCHAQPSSCPKPVAWPPKVRGSESYPYFCAPSDRTRAARIDKTRGQRRFRSWRQRSPAAESLTLHPGSFYRPAACKAINLHNTSYGSRRARSLFHPLSRPGGNIAARASPYRADADATRSWIWKTENNPQIRCCK
jgi:hypothetical protein